MSPKTYNEDKAFLKEHLNIVELNNDKSGLLVSPDLQGRVITSTSGGDDSYSYGWINYDLIASGEFLPHCNNFGGEDRFWIGPEGGQFSIFFEKKASFDLENWQTPSPIDTEKWNVTEQSKSSVKFKRNIELENYSGFYFNIDVERDIKLFNKNEIENSLNIQIPQSIETVGFETDNKITNKGENNWSKETGLLSIWILGQFKPSENNTVIVPFKGEFSDSILNDSYFGKIDSDRIKITDNAILFKGDGQKRGKIGLKPEATLPIVGSYDEKNSVLTIVQFSFNEDASDYVNSMWEYQENPYDGDVINSYNDGPLPDGTIMGPFYELETSSCAPSLEIEDSIKHVHKTFHFKGDKNELNNIAIKLLNTSIEERF